MNIFNATYLAMHRALDTPFVYPVFGGQSSQTVLSADGCFLSLQGVQLVLPATELLVIRLYLELLDQNLRAKAGVTLTLRSGLLPPVTDNLRRLVHHTTRAAWHGMA